MKVLMATMKLDIGGAETHIVEVAKELKRRGVEVVVASNGGVFVKELEKAGIRHIWAPMHNKKPQTILRAYRVLNHLLKQEHFDIIHIHARIPAFVCYPLAKKHHIRYVSTAHLTFHINPMWKKIMHWGESVVAVSEDIKQYLIDYYGVCSDNISVTINGINPDTFSPDTDWSDVQEEFHLDPTKRRIVSISRLDTDRSFASLCLAKAAPELCRAFGDLEFLIVGGGDDYDRVSQAAAQSNREIGYEAVKLTGARTDINKMAAAGDVFIGVSRAVLEAMAIGKPCIVAGNEGYLGIFTEDKFVTAYNSNFCCRGCPMTDQKTLIKDITTLLSMPLQERKELSDMGRRIVLEHYSVGRMADDYQALYERVRPYAYQKYGDILISGYYGFHNLGDESLLRAILQNLRELDPDIHISVLSHSPKETQRDYGVKGVQRMNLIGVCIAMKNAQVMLHGGGNLLQDSSSNRSLYFYATLMRMAKHYGIKQMLYANGLGPLNRQNGQKSVSKCLKLLDVMSLREEYSIWQAKLLGVEEKRIVPTADPAFSLTFAPVDRIAFLRKKFGFEDGKKYFGVALRQFKKNGNKNLTAVALAIRAIAEKYDIIPVFLPMQIPKDLEINRQAKERSQTKSLMVYDITGMELMGLLQTFEFSVSMRLHTLIFSASAGIPSIGIAYDDKISAFLQGIEMPWCLKENPLTEKILLSAVSELMERKDEFSQMLQEKKPMLRSLAMQDAKITLDLLSKNYGASEN